MLWHKSWLETRWRFLAGAGILAIVACGTVFDYRFVAGLLPMLDRVDPSRLATDTPLGRVMAAGIEAQRTYSGYIWWQWFRQNLAQIWTLFAILIGSGGLLSKGSTLFTMSLPASRNRVIGVRAATGLAELLVLAIVPSLVIPLLSPAVGQHYAVSAVVVQGLCLFVAGAAFFSLALLLSTVFPDLWSPLLITVVVAVAVGMSELLLRGGGHYGVFGLMSAADYYHTGHLPWGGLLVSAATSAAILSGAAWNFAQTDF
jgi:hypothetical protein